jgi:6-phosphogluconolactonase (cycloisomerase 2 family)
LTTRGANGYVTIAHSDEVALIKHGELIALTGSGTQHAPCWLTLVDQFLYSSNSPSHSISRYVVTGTQVVLDAAVAATTAGAPTDIASSAHLMAVLDGGAQTHLTQFSVDGDGDLHQTATTIVSNGANGVVVIQR